MPSALASVSPEPAAMQPGGIWVHAVSVGESIAAAPMIRALLQRYPQLPITVTCMTPTGSERIQALFATSRASSTAICLTTCRAPPRVF
jgi:3-deoxy-D-manno-octulosonic-acid transferase